MKIQKKEKKKHEKQIGKSFKGNAANINNRSYVQHECICSQRTGFYLKQELRDSTECTVSGTEWSDNQTESGCYTEENTVLQEKRKVHV